LVVIGTANWVRYRAVLLYRMLTFYALQQSGRVKRASKMSMEEVDAEWLVPADGSVRAIIDTNTVTHAGVPIVSAAKALALIASRL